ncbi:hypothetical protein PSI15_17470, partial [Xenorhabdus sp. PR6a]|uniref:hypothetical protein n=1 Tax=Xenorhabdus sp. PR6a TaxID=3025877 RepID=UPI00235908E7
DRPPVAGAAWSVCCRAKLSFGFSLSLWALSGSTVGETVLLYCRNNDFSFCQTCGHLTLSGCGVGAVFTPQT